MNTRTEQERELELEQIVERTLVPHTAFDDAYKRIDQAFRFSENASEAVYIGLVGESGSGKTRLLEYFYHKHEAHRTEDQLFVPILRVSVPPSPTVKGFLETLLKEIGDPSYHIGSKTVMEDRLKTMMRQAGTRMLMVDEFQHFVETKSDQRIVDTSNMFKRLVDDTKVVLVAAGIDSFIGVFKDTQLKTRFNSMLEMPKFDWTHPLHRAEFIAILEGFHVSLSTYFNLPELHGESMSFRCFYATQGILRLLTKFLRQVVRNAIDQNTFQITLEDLALAYEQTLLPASRDMFCRNPFDKSFRSYEELLVASTSQGASKVPVPTSMSPTAAPTYRTLNQILSAS